MPAAKRDWSVFISSFFFVLGFSVIFSIVGILLQTILSHATLEVQTWLDRIGGVIIILCFKGEIGGAKSVISEKVARHNTAEIRHSNAQYGSIQIGIVDQGGINRQPGIGYGHRRRSSSEDQARGDIRAIQRHSDGACGDGVG